MSRRSAQGATGKGKARGAPPGSRRWRLFRLWPLGLLGVAVLEMGLHLYQAQRMPGFDDWAAINRPVDAIAKPGDLVVVAPRWAEPMARRALGDARFPIGMAARADELRFGHAVEISIQGQGDPTLKSWIELERTKNGPFTFRRLENPHPVATLFDFTEHLSPEQLTVSIAGEPCPFSAHAKVLAGGLGGHPTFPTERFECPGGPFFNVSKTVIADQDFLPRQCIWAHPPNRGALRLVFRDVPLGKSIRGHHGMYWIIERNLSGAPVFLSVSVDGTPIGRIEHRDGDGWAPFSLPTPEGVGAQGEVVFEVTTEDFRHRHYCFEAIAE